MTIPDGEEVIYTGTYKISTNALRKEVFIYVQVERKNEDKEKVYVRATSLIKKEEQEVEESETISRVKKTTISSRVNETRKTAGKEGETYTIAIAAGHNNTNDTGARKGTLKEEELTIKTAEKVEELLKPYTNINVVQTGSTADNRGGVQVRDRVRLAREANPDLCIQIHYDAGGGSGVQGIYKAGDEVSSQLAEFLSNGMAEAMGLPNKGAGSDQERTAVKNLGIIENSATSGFPSVVTEGGFVDGEPDATLLNSNGTELCANGIVEGILKYLEADHSGLVAVEQGDETVQESIETRVYNLKYIEPNEMENYINNRDLKALEFFTLNDDKKLITATWEKTSGGEIEIKQNSAMDFRIALQKYIMPYEYLLYFYIDTNIQEFSEQLAEEVLKTEIVIAIEDNVKTIKTVETTKEKQEATMSEYNYEGKEINTQTTITESCTPKIEVTYADAWCVKYYKENSYSRTALNWQEGETEQILNIKGKVTVTENHTSTAYEAYQSGEAQTGKVDKEGDPITYEYTKYRKIETDTKEMDIKYDTGKGKTKGNENKFVKLYQDNNMPNWVREGKLFRIIEDNERTVNLLTLTKYLMYKATSNKYGKVEYAFSEFDLDAFENIGGGYYGDWNGGTPEEFIQAIAPYAVIDMEQHKIYASVTIAQAIIESGWGMDNIALTYKNFFGMKAGGASANEYWFGESVALGASEGGISSFRVYDSLKNSVYDHGRNFHVTPTYATHGVLDCMEQNLGPAEQLNRIAASGYAVYADGSISKPDGVRLYGQYLYEEFIVKYDLEKYDKMSSADFAGMDSNSGAQQVVSLARSKLGCPYEWGAVGPDSFDCSGLVYWIFNTELGISVPRTTYGYASYKGTDKEVSMNDIQPGDILLTPEHAGIYIGNNEYIHAPDVGDVVKISSGAKEAFTYAIRMIQSSDGPATEMQNNIVRIASSQDTLGTGRNWCQAWIAAVYNKAGQSWISSCCAGSAGEQWIVSQSRDNIPLGACVYGKSNPYVGCDCGRDAGHVGIYIGDGKVASNVGGIRIESLDSWIAGFGWRGWGWNGGTDYSH